MIHEKVDLNLYRVLLTIYEQRSITLAAQHLHLTQPAVSHALARLRAVFDDPLFTRDGRAMQPTAKMLAMVPVIAEATQALSSLPQQIPRFNIGDYKGTLTLGVRDLLEMSLLPRLNRRIQTEAPGIHLQTELPTLQDLEQYFASQDVDVMVDALTPTSSKVLSQFLFEEKFTVVGRSGHPFFKRKSLRAYLSHSHLVVTLKGASLNSVDLALAQQKNRALAQRHVQIHCEHYMAGLKTVAESDLLMTMPRSFATEMQSFFDIKLADPPFKVPSIPVYMYWHQRNQDDPAVTWLRQTIEAELKNSLE